MIGKNRSCKYCGESVIGRSDKIFCCTDCRTEYHNKENRRLNKRIRTINSILKKNYKILKDHNDKGQTKVTKQSLMEANFNFQYFTNLYTTKKGQTYFFIYDQGYLFINAKLMALVNKKSYIP